MQIAGRVAVVTGGGSGIGRAMCQALAEREARVIVADRDLDAATATANALGASARPIRVDVTDPAQVSAALRAAVDAFGSLDIMCNNAGIGGESIFEDETGEWRRMVDINLTAVIEGTAQAVKLMRRRVGGVVVNTASMGGLLPMPNSPVYAATKAGVINFTRSLAYLAQETPPIRVNAICPSYVDTPLIHRDGNEQRVQEVAQALGGLLEPEDIAAGLIELLEDDSRAGAIMRVTMRGGRDYAREIRP